MSAQTKSLKDFTTDDILDWIEDNITGQAEVKEPVKYAMELSEFKGSDLIQVNSIEDFIDLKITRFMSKRLFNGLKEAFPNEFPADIVARKEQANDVDDALERLVRENARKEQAMEARKLAQRRQAAQAAQATQASAASGGGMGPVVNAVNTGNASHTNNIYVNSNGHNGHNGHINGDINRTDSFHVSIFIGSKRKQTKNVFTCDSTVLQLKQEIIDTETGGAEKPEDIRLTFNTKQLVNYKTLGQSGITSQSCHVHVIFNLKGGSSSGSSGTSGTSATSGKSLLTALIMNAFDLNHFVSHAVFEEKEEKKEKKEKKNENEKVYNYHERPKKLFVWATDDDADTRERVPRFSKNKNITPSLEPDCIMFDDSQTLRVKMPCGHVFAPISIFKWSQRTLNVLSKARVCCPILECQEEWKIDDIVCAAGLDEKEHESLAYVLSNRQLMETDEYKQCPGCDALVLLPEELGVFRVHCKSKECANKRDFCWICGYFWKSGGFAVCGNDTCYTAYVNEMLKIENCGYAENIMGRPDAKCPKKRACPRCLAITEYKDDCKHFTCWQCHRSFCFICLSLAGKEQNGKGADWACDGGDSHGGKCKVAPVQYIH